MLKEILGESSLTQFFESEYLEQPYALPSAATRLPSILDWELFWKLIPHIPDKEILVVRNGHLLPGPAPRTPEAGELLFKTGFSIVLRRVQNAHLSFKRLASDLSRELDAQVVIQLYATPGDYYSFGWHYDAEEVFILQVAGEKKYYLRENTVNPRPRLSAMPEDMHFERETTPLLGATLISGDFLYIPGGWWHMATAEHDSLSISIGALPRGSA